MGKEAYEWGLGHFVNIISADVAKVIVEYLIEPFSCLEKCVQKIILDGVLECDSMGICSPGNF